MSYDHVRVHLDARPIRTVKLINGYMVCWLLWSGAESYKKYISGDLMSRIKAWESKLLNHNFQYETGWKVPDPEKWHFEEGKALEDLFNEELDADPSTDGFVYLDFWETSG
jgi:hypothetical protein